MKKIVQTVLLAAPLIVSSASFALAAYQGQGQGQGQGLVRAASIPAVPEPSTFILFGAGAAGFILYKKFKK